ncbi:hypothetical protein N7470_009424 [Penicillium chermesinum]|nr:hypothetical protein N7470_009424 [Penicillium chermesinum]
MSASHGSSTGAPGIPTGLHDSRNDYNPATKGYNPATGANYSKPQESLQSQPTTSASNSYDGVKTDRVHHPPPTGTAQRTQFGESNDSRAAQVGGGVARGAGESLRGAANAAVDRAFGSDEGAEWNEEIARRGENEIRNKEFGKPLPREH